jgi:hypothetical protein
MVLATAFLVIVLGSQVLATVTGNPDLGLVAAFVRAGALVFGGGHVVLPLLDSGVVRPGWVTEDQFLAGYGAAQALPGPLFSFAGYLGAVSTVGPGGVPGGLPALVAIFLPAPSSLAALPVVGWLRGRPGVESALAGVQRGGRGSSRPPSSPPVMTGSLTSPLAVVVAAAGVACCSSRGSRRWSWLARQRRGDGTPRVATAPRDMNAAPSGIRPSRHGGDTSRTPHDPGGDRTVRREARGRPPSLSCRGVGSSCAVILGWPRHP